MSTPSLLERGSATFTQMPTPTANWYMEENDVNGQQPVQFPRALVFPLLTEYVHKAYAYSWREAGDRKTASQSV